MTTQTEALKALIHEMEYVLTCINEDKIPFDGDDFHEALRLGKEALSSPNGEALPEQLTDEQLKPHYQNQEWLDGVRFAEAAHGIKE